MSSGNFGKLRVLNLLLELLESDRGRTKAELRTREFYATVSDEAFEAAFQRDKDTLRDAGISLDLVESSRGIVYRVSPDSFSRGAPSLNRADIALIDTAVSAWSRLPEQWSSIVRSKVRGRSTDEDARALPLTMTLDGAEAVGAIWHAINEHIPIAFTYISPSGTFERAVEPWQLIFRSNSLYLWGFDLDREGPRVFKLSRMRSNIEELGEPGDAASAPTGTTGPFTDLLVSPLLLVRDGACPHIRVCAVGEGGSSHEGGSLPVPPPGWEYLQGEQKELGEWMLLILREPASVIVKEPAQLRDVLLERLRAAATLDLSGFSGEEWGEAHA